MWCQRILWQKFPTAAYALQKEHLKTSEMGCLMEKSSIVKEKGSLIQQKKTLESKYQKLELKQKVVDLNSTRGLSFQSSKNHSKTAVIYL